MNMLEGIYRSDFPNELDLQKTLEKFSADCHAKLIKENKRLIPHSQDVKELFFNDGVYMAVEYAINNPEAVVPKGSPKFAQIERAFRMMRGRIDKRQEKYGNFIKSTDCLACGFREECSENYVTCLGRPALFFGNEKSVVAAFDALRSKEDKRASRSLLRRMRRLILKEFPDEFYPPYTSEPTGEKAMRLIRYAAILREAVASGAVDNRALLRLQKAIKMYLLPYTIAIVTLTYYLVH